MSNYLLCGTDNELINKKIEDIELSLKTTFDENKYDLETENVYSIISEAKTIPFLSDYKVVVVKGIESFLIKKDITDSVNYLLEYLRHPVQSTILILISTSELKDNSFYKAIVNSLTYTKCDITTSNPKEFVTDLFSLDMYTIDNDALELLLSIISDRESLKVEVSKLKSYCYETRKVTRADVDLIVPKNLETNIYELINAVIAHDKKRAMHIYIDLDTIKTAPMVIISSLLSKFQEIFDVKKLLSGGYKQEEIANLYNVKSGRAYYMIKNANSFSLYDIERNLKTLSDMEADIKTGYADAEMSLQMYILK